MEEKKIIRVSLGTAICINIIIVLIILMVAMYVYYNNDTIKKDNIGTLDKTENISNNKIETTSNNVDNAEIKNTFNIVYETEFYRIYSNNKKLICESKRNIPTITFANNQNIANKIIKSIKELSDKEWTIIKSASDDFNNETYQNDLLGVNRIMTTNVLTNQYVTFKIEQNGSFGGVSWNDIKLYNYDITTGELVSFANIAKDYKNFEKVVCDEVIKSINSKDINVITDDLDDELPKLISTNGNWGFTKEGIVIVLPKYSIADGASGVIETNINKSKINVYLKEEYKL